MERGGIEIHALKELRLKRLFVFKVRYYNPPVGDASGMKLQTTVSITGNENDKGELTSLSASKPEVEIGPTPNWRKVCHEGNKTDGFIPCCIEDGSRPTTNAFRREFVNHSFGAGTATVGY